VAWKLKPATDGTADTTTDQAGGDAAGDVTGDDANPYGGLATQGTVTVVQGTNQTTPDVTIKTNETWVNDGAKWLVDNNKADGTTALAALTKYINDADLTYDEGQLVNQVIKEFGTPPDGVSGTGIVGSKPAQKQITPPGYHTVTGNFDNTYMRLAGLYFGANSATEKNDLIQADPHNLSVGDGPFPNGTKIYIPAYHPPKWYVPTAPISKASAASKNGITRQQLDIFNNGPKYNGLVTIPKGYQLRVG